MPRVSSGTSTSQREQAYLALRRLLILQQIEPGQRLREPKWAERLKVHRSALREAFARLEAEGLINRGERTGYFVPELTPADIEEVTKVRLALECLAIEEICAQPKPNLSNVVAATEEFNRFLEGAYSLGVIEADRRFHESLIDAAGMQRLSLLYHHAPLPLLHAESEDQHEWRESCVRTLSEHQQILGMLVSRDAAGAKRLLRIHLMKRPTLPARQ